MSQVDGKTIEIIPLARRKIARRGIAEAWVEETLTAPEQVVEGYAGRWVAQRRISIQGKEQLLRVVYEETAISVIVVTAYLTSDIARYWRETA